MIKIKNLGNNKVELHMSNGDIIFFSYDMPVAAKMDDVVITTNTRYSTTTRKHIYQWLDGVIPVIVTQETINNLLKYPIEGDLT